MPLSYPLVFIPLNTVTPISQSFNNTFVGKFNVVLNTGPLIFTLNSDIIYTANAEIVIKNSKDSTNDITLAFSGVTIDKSADLVPIIPVGGIAELKRRGLTNTWDLYGYLKVA